MATDSTARKMALSNESASNITITDTSNYFTSGNVEGALSETGMKINELEGHLDGFELQLAQKANEADLNEERNARLAEVAVERERINSFTSLASGSTTGDAELIDGRTSDGITYENIGTNVRNKVTKYLYLLKNSALASGTTSKTVSIDGTNGLTKYVVIKNRSASSGYFGIHGYNASGTQVYSTPSDQLINAGGSYVYQISPTVTASRLDIVNVNNRTSCTVDVYIDYDIAIKDTIKKALYLVNDAAITFINAPKVVENSTLNSSGDRSIKFTTSAINGKVTITTGETVNENDYIFHRLKVKASADCLLNLTIYGVTTGQSSFGYRLKANKEYELYFRTKQYTASEVGALKFVYQCDTSGVTIDITNAVAVKNSLEVWYDETDKATMKEYDSTYQIVDANGYGNIYNLPEALDFVKKIFDVNTIPVTLFVKNGYYLQYPTNVYPYAPINKGANKISIVGESRDGVVIECYNTAITQSKVIDIGGECTIENLTILSLNDGTYNAGNDLSHNCYCIHNDTGMGAQSKQYLTTVKNCKLISNCHSPVGAGLRDKQIQHYEKCEFISDGFLSAGALYVHASTESYAVNMGIEIIDCSCVSLDGTKAITLPNTTGFGALPYTDIPVTIQRTIGYSNGSKVTDDNFKTTHNLQPQSALNNVTDWNY